MTDHNLMGTCPNCGTTLPESNGTTVRIWCNEKCRKAYAYRIKKNEFPPIFRPDKPCVECGTMFPPKSASHHCCSPKCSSIGKRRRKRERRESRESEAVVIHFHETRQCARPGCVKTFEVTNKNSSRIYCHNDCNRLMYNARRYGQDPLKKTKYIGAVPDYRNHMIDAETVRILRAYQ